ncbi:MULTISPECIES: hypothetical protein [Pontibacillus]|uniref:DUF4367 domain-containing protein n=1 Tax=Pontibacillus chungwhensis TaxID=265426 RepID=A0ABY8UVT6_9BACI|nr:MULTISPECIES: hypothetical protein [Pontibacillus]MCD5323100.1 hypothetical protein [Pontibacillus sp. HN14]WIF96489.1 hypothetical protein QNI29_12080 [Pontibacillus chungwhensis]
MKKWWSIGVLIGLLLLLSACGDQTSSENLAQLKEHYPTLKNQLNELSQEQLEQIKVPDYIPFEVTDVQAITSSENPSHIEIIFTNGQLNLHVMTMSHQGELYTSDTGIDLQNGAHAKFKMNEFGNELQWSKESESRAYIVKLMAYPPSQPQQFTKEDVIKIANSMYKM